jgi:predicted metal-dependent enzyme (double-stranded beta helix superfamily)
LLDRLDALDGESYDVEAFIIDIKTAAKARTVEERVVSVQRVLVDACLNHHGFLPERFLRPSEGGTYARRPLYIDPHGRISVLVMVWDRGQGTPLHNHGGEWVVECLYEGKMRVTNFELLSETDGRCLFEQGDTLHALPGDASYRIPPHEHHILESDQDEPSVTIHVFGGLMQRCDIFESLDHGYRRVPKELIYTP